MAFVTKKVYDNGQNDVFEIANITPSTFASLINAKVYDSQGNQVEIVSLENRNFINDSYKLVLENGTEVNFTINDKGNIVVSETTGDFQKLKDNSNYVLESISAFTKGQPLLLKNGEEIGAEVVVRGIAVIKLKDETYIPLEILDGKKETIDMKAE